MLFKLLIAADVRTHFRVVVKELLLGDEAFLGLRVPCVVELTDEGFNRSFTAAHRWVVLGLVGRLQVL